MDSGDGGLSGGAKDDTKCRQALKDLPAYSILAHQHFAADLPSQQKSRALFI